MTGLIPGTEGGTHVGGGPLTTNHTMEASPELLKNSIDERIVKVRPMSTPIDQLSRCAGSRGCGSMTVEYYSVDTKMTEAAIAENMDDPVGVRRGDDFFTFIIKTTADEIFEVSETVLVPQVKGYNGSIMIDEPLVLYVTGRPAEGGVEVCPLNGRVSSQNGQRVIGLPELPSGTPLVRMGRAAAELDVQTGQFSALPRKDSNNCQIFKMQVEQSTMQKIADKEIGWNFTDQEEAAIIDMRLGMEKNFLFGKRAMIFDTIKNEPVYFTGGIWHQTSKQFSLNLATLKETDLVSMCSEAFTRNAGSKRKILIAGTQLIEAMNKCQLTRMVQGKDTMVKWGLEFREIRSNFGSLYVLHSEVFDQCGHSKDGFVLDPDYITKYCHVPFNVETLDLRRSGVRNTDAVVITEASCLVLRYPNAHMKVIGR